MFKIIDAKGETIADGYKSERKASEDMQVYRDHAREADIALPMQVVRETHEFEPDIAGLTPERCKRLDCRLRSNASVHSESN